jgi:Zn2+/Cd2+-exporting ATPase
MQSPTATNSSRRLVALRGLLFGDLQATLTTLCGLALLVSFFPSAYPAAYVSVACGSYYAVRSTWDSLRTRHIDVNLLMVMAALGAVTINRVQDSAGLLFLFSLSSTMESFAMSKTKSAIESLVRLRPATAVRVVDGVETVVPVESLRTGDVIRVNGFESVPTDGEVIDGVSSVDESALTGESVPVPKSVNAPVTGGTQNLDGTLFVQVTKEIGNSVLDQIVDLVKTAQENKASGEQISEWFGQRYTVFVIVAFAVAWVVRLALRQPGPDAFYAALVLLVGLSPCALVISTPASTLSALANAARKGILIRGGEFIEKAASINVIAMDKTGTLTRGKPRLVGMALFREQILQWAPGTVPPEDVREILSRVASVEVSSSHPLALALVQTARTEGIVPQSALDTRIVPGKGAVGTVDGIPTPVGNARLLADLNFEIPPELAAITAKWKSDGLTSVLAAGPDFVAGFAFEDEIRPESHAVLQDLRQLGIKEIFMLTGDKRETADSVGERLGVTKVYAALLPEDKTKIIREASERSRVMMVGDGVNDAPSLALATIGVAMGGLGSEVALNAADIVLMHDRLDRIPDLIRLARRTRTIIRTNLIFAAAMIVVLTVASFAIRLPLPFAVIGHEGSTVLVILNGLRLLRD